MSKTVFLHIADNLMDALADFYLNANMGFDESEIEKMREECETFAEKHFKQLCEELNVEDVEEITTF